MSGDYSRVRFDPRQDFLGVLMQQGRVQLDADWNELVAEITRRIQAGMLDATGEAIVPRETPHGFEINVAGGKLTIGCGRIYIDGILAENHGADQPMVWDPHLAELRGADSTTVDYAAQDYYPKPQVYPDPPALPDGGPHLVYLDVWQRERGAVEAPGMVEQAVGVDSTARLQTVWEVKVLANVGTAVHCDTQLDTVPGFLEKNPPAASRLSVTLAPDSSVPNECLVPPMVGYKGLENQLYRVEIHDGGKPGTATFKWSRDNASVATRVITIKAPDKVEVQSLGRDAVLGFQEGDWVELTDDFAELNGQPGQMYRIKIGGGIDVPTKTITFATAIDTTKLGNTDDLISQRNTRLRRWDQHGKVRKADDTEYDDLDTSTTGVIKVPSLTSTVSLFLEAGILVTFSLDTNVDANGRFRSGDYWVFAARSADGTVEQLQNAPPRGIHHHFCKLALVTFPSTKTDCRTMWPPDIETDCGCTVCVSADTQNSNPSALQQAIDQVKEKGGTICLGPGTYHLKQPLQLTEGGSVRIVGQGWKTILITTGGGLNLAKATDVSIERVAILAAGEGRIPSPTINISDCFGVTIDRCALLSIAVPDKTTHLLTSQPVGLAVGLTGIAAGIEITGSVLYAAAGIGGPLDTEPGFVATAGLSISNNLMVCDQYGVSFRGAALHILETRVADNTIGPARQAAIVALGETLLNSPFDILSNDILAGGRGIVVGGAGVRVCDNDVTALERAEGDGIVLMAGQFSPSVAKCQVISNRVTGAQRYGIVIQAPVSSLMIKQNVIDKPGLGGIVMIDDATATHLVIENNHLTHIAAQANDPGESIAAVRILKATHVAIADNVIDGVGQAGIQAPGCYGVQLIACAAARITGNRIVGLGPAGAFLGEAIGIDILGPFASTDVVDNAVQRRVDITGQLGRGHWLALRVRHAASRVTQRLGSNATLSVLGNAFAIWTGSAVWVFQPPAVRGETLVRGNLFEALATSSNALVVQGTDLCVLSENRCLLTGSSIEFGIGAAVGELGAVGALAGMTVALPAIVRVDDTSLIASNNRLRGPQSHDAMVVSQAPRITVLGNIASSKIKVGTQDLGVPWNSLNVMDLP
jgi:hypothetical protein